MLLNLFNEMRAAKVPVSVRELLDLIDALKHRVVFADMDEFYYLARTIMVKDERHFDKFDRAFGAYFKGLEKLDAVSYTHLDVYKRQGEATTGGETQPRLAHGWSAPTSPVATGRAGSELCERWFMEAIRSMKTTRGTIAGLSLIHI